MSPWQLKTNPSRTYERPLGITEQLFHLIHNSLCSATETLQNSEIEIDDAGIFDQAAVSKAWIQLKHKHPLLAAQVQQRAGKAFFLVEEARLKSLVSDEITFLSFSTLQEVRDFEQDILNNKNSLSDHLLARLFIIARTDATNRYHVLTLAAHAITDGVANSSILRTFLDLLVTSENVPMWPLENRLALCLPTEDLAHTHTLSVARQRWRSAIANVIASFRDARSKGGQTLPGTFTKTPVKPAVSRRVTVSFSPQQSNAVIENCRSLGFTFGAAYPVIGQIAMARVLVRRRIKGEIDSSEWLFRRTEPMFKGAPANVRSFLDKDWYRNGGSEIVSLGIGFFTIALGLLPLGVAAFVQPGGVLPAFEEMLSRKRFIQRCLRVKMQSTEQLKDPLFLDINIAQRVTFIHYIRSLTQDATVDDSPLSPLEQSLAGSVSAFGGSSFGSRDKFLPLDYPLEGAKKLRLVDFSVQLRCRPAELYLGAMTIRQHLQLFVYWDENVYAADIVEEWLQEVKEAVEHYLLHQNYIDALSSFACSPWETARSSSALDALERR